MCDRLQSFLRRLWCFVLCYTLLYRWGCTTGLDNYERLGRDIHRKLPVLGNSELIGIVKKF